MVVVPIAFVSEHVETLVELDRDYAAVAAKAGATPYIRVPALGADATFIGGLADLVETALTKPGVAPGAGACAAGLARCAPKSFCEVA